MFNAGKWSDFNLKSEFLTLMGSSNKNQIEIFEFDVIGFYSAGYFWVTKFGRF